MIFAARIGNTVKTGVNARAGAQGAIVFEFL
jgi:hypothetical protein